MFDVFYSGIKPGVCAHERRADSIEHAQQLSRTGYFWWITYLSDYTEFDFLYVPPPWQSQFTHVWPSQHHAYSGTYLVPRTATETQYYFHAEILPNKESLNHYVELTPSEFDHTWAPHPHDPPYIYVFGNQWWSAETWPTVEYHVPGATERKYMYSPRAVLPQNPNRPWYNVVADCDWDYSWHPDPGDSPYIYVFGNQWWPAEKMPTIEYRAPGATEHKYVDWPRAELSPSLQNWTVPSGINIAEFDFSWVPDPGDPPYVYQFATQHQKTGGPVYTVPGATETKYLSEIKVSAINFATATVEIDHMDGNAGQILNTVRRVRYFDNYKDTLIRVAKSLVGQHEYVWICSSVCDYSEFDFSWHPEKWQSTMLHVFASDDQKFGDTFFMHVPTFADRAESRALLEWYDVNFVRNIMVPRRALPVQQHTGDSHVDTVRQLQTHAPLTLIANGAIPHKIPAVNLWRAETKTAVPLNKSGSVLIVPREAVTCVKTQLYDYPLIDKTHRSWAPDQSMDVIFISNGESMAEQNWQHLKSICPRARRSDGVNGRELAYKTAAELSTTPWFYAVFAKTEVFDTFKFDYQPDWLQQPKHYIFHSRNPLNGLEYGAMNVNLYNRQLVLDTEPGIDFTLSAAHEVVPICISVTRFNTDPWVTWRSAFREVLKLQLEVDQGADVEIQYRLNTWLTVAQGHNAEWCLAGGQDAVQYYKSVSGNYEKLQLSFDWQWLQDYYHSLYKTTPWLEL
jgi:hypothetical protein